MANSVTTKVLLGAWSKGAEALIEAQGLNEGQLRNAVNSALGQMQIEGTPETSGKTKFKAGSKDNPDTFRLTQKEVAKFTASGSAPLRLFHFNQEMVALESAVGQIDLNGWPEWIAQWAVKFAQPKE